MYQAFLIHVFDSVLRRLPVHDEFEAELKQFWLPKHSRSDKLMLFHYTDVSGLHGIIESRALWATDARFLNDRSEIDHGRDFILEKIDERASKSSSDSIKRFLQEMAGELKIFFGPTRWYRVFVVCFCEKPSLLSQWRAYSEKGGGYALGFEFSNSTKTIKALADEGPDQYQRVALRKVIYSDEEKHDLVEVLLDKACDFFFKLKELPGFEDDMDTDLAAAALINFLSEMIYCFKDWSFREEKEWRLVRVIDSDYIPKACKFRPRGQYIVPYVPTPLFNITENGSAKIFPLKSIVLGPTVDLMRSKLSLQHFCSSGTNPYGIELDSSKVGIHESGIPYRGST